MKIRNYVFIIGFLAVMNVFCWHEVFVLSEPRLLKVDFFDVGQGDAAFIETPNHRQILIDGGPDSVVLEKLANKMPFWDKTIDIVILSHPEKDHMTGILEVLQRYKVDYFLWSGVFKDNAESKKLAMILDQVQRPRSNFWAHFAAFFAAAKNAAYTKVSAVSAGEKIKIDGAEIDILFPFENIGGKQLKDSASANDTCIVDKITYGKNSFLFIGDISSTIEKQLVNSGENILANVLKVAHHGSKYSTSDLFLENVRPEIAVISVGKNSYGHPTPEVLQKLENFGIQIKRTDTEGDVEIVSDGQNIKLNN